jgi:hypothetical protein
MKQGFNCESQLSDHNDHGKIPLILVRQAFTTTVLVGIEKYARLVYVC